VGLDVDQHRDVCHAAIGERRPTGELDHVLDMRGTHDPRVVHAHVHEQLVEFDILLGVGMQKIVELQAGYREDRLTVELCVIEAIEKVDAARTGSADADPQLARELGIAAGHEGRRLLVAHLHEAHPILLLTKRFDQAVDSVTGDSKDDINSPSISESTRMSAAVVAMAASCQKREICFPFDNRRPCRLFPTATFSQSVSAARGNEPGDPFVEGGNFRGDDDAAS
jgi:hypothetical protein